MTSAKELADRLEERKAIASEIYEFGEIERDAEMLADFSTHGGFLWGFWSWIGGIARNQREDLVATRQEVDEELRAAHTALKSKGE